MWYPWSQEVVKKFHIHFLPFLCSHQRTINLDRGILEPQTQQTNLQKIRFLFPPVFSLTLEFDVDACPTPSLACLPIRWIRELISSISWTHRFMLLSLQPFRGKSTVRQGDSLWNLKVCNSLVADKGVGRLEICIKFLAQMRIRFCHCRKIFFSRLTRRPRRTPTCLEKLSMIAH